MSDTPTQFSDLKLDPKVLQAVSEAGYATPTPIQLGAIPPALEGRDVLGIAQTGTGKTAGFVLPMITLLGRGRARARMPRSLVLCPTRELAAQVAENFDTYARHTKLTKALLIGGVSFGEQDKLIDRGVDVLIATPGRLLDHFERGKLLLTGVQIMVVDEADRMLDMGFIPDIERIFTLTPFTRQTLFFSATMAPEIERITDTFLHAPARIEVARQATASETIEQRLVEITPTRKDQTAKQKRELMRALIDAEGEDLKNAIIFCNRKTEVDIVAKSLKAHGYDAAPIHGDLDQSQRTRTLEGFREGTLRFLVASDVAARGLDIPAVSHVFNFDLPSHAEDYVHRIGRTGRAGREGTAISLGVPADEKYLAAIESLLKRTLPRAPVPEGFSLSDAAQSAPRPREERSSRSRNGRDRREKHAPDARRPAAEVRPPREARAEPRREEPRREEQHRNDRPGPARESRTDGRTEARAEGRTDIHRRDEPRRDEQKRDDQRHDSHRRDDRRRDDRKDERRPAVVGLGDHVPDFLTRSFRTSLPPDSAAEDATPAAKVEAPAAAPGAEAPASASRSSRSRRSRKPAVAEVASLLTPAESAPPASENVAPAPEAPAEISAAEVRAAGTPAEIPAAEAAAPEASPIEAAKPASAPRTRRTKAAPAEDAAAPATDAEAPAARTRSRRKPAAATGKEPAAAPGDAAPESESAAPAPRRTRSRRKPADAADAGTPPAQDAPVAEGESPAPAPRRTRSRRKPADEAAPAADAATPAETPVVRDEA